ncbi:DUF3263 domain-containing protein [Trueperella bernardiae]|uniref:DUF3263 domain-containing protein n=1 Tax=Trueperella bernardiae TaxID=59561 RepID=UPI0020447B7A|nr:DUF3263 domain-containing protein [Trueperella bernardiae]MCM3908102.1 DUF3263 domain-containing protein [Trueperella bernardiae]
MDDELTEVERSILDIERGWWRMAPTREQAIQRQLGMTASKYYLVLSRMLDEPRVWTADPALVDRLRRLRDSRLTERGFDLPEVPAPHAPRGGGPEVGDGSDLGDGESGGEGEAGGQSGQDSQGALELDGRD